MKSIFAFILFFVISFQAGCALTEFNSQYYQLVDEYIHFTFKHNPSYATYVGVHDYNQELEDFSKKGARVIVNGLKDFDSKFSAIEFKKLSSDEQIEYELIKNHIQATLLELETIRPRENNPDFYGTSVSDSIYSLISRNFAPPKDRLRSVINREKKILTVFAIAKENLKNPPKIFTQLALEQLPGTISFFQNDVPAAFVDIQDPNLIREFKITNNSVVEKLIQYKNYLEKEILPKSNGDFRLGSDVYRKKLKYREMVDLPLDTLLDIGYKDLRSNQDWIKKVAQEINANKSVADILIEMNLQHPLKDELLNTFRTTLREVKKFVKDKKIVTISSPKDPILQETPAYARALSIASMDPPGPFETKVKEAFFNVTLPESHWSKAETEAFLQEQSIYFINSTVIHEAYPGHFVQFLLLPKVSSKIKKIFPVMSNLEGWAHYCEQMVLDEGFRISDPKMRMAQLQDALLRNARYIVAIKMHTGKMSFDEAIEFFIKEAYQTRAMAEREVKRGAVDPTYLYYTLGKLEILKLREDYKKLQGNQFSLQKFHDRFLEMGPIPIRQIRRVLVGKEEDIL